MARLLPERVDNLVINILVDNSIEWMTKLPPGFQHEVHQHLQTNPPVDPVTGTPFLDLENFCCGAHGFAALVTTQKTGEQPRTVLFDTGPDSKTIIRNIEALKYPVPAIERIVLSHWHADHSGGMLSFLKHAKQLTGDNSSNHTAITVDLHPDRPEARGIAPPPSFAKVVARLPHDPTFEEISECGAIVERHSDPHLIAGDTMFVSGAIERHFSHEKGLLGAVRWVKKDDEYSWVKDTEIYDERYLAVDVTGKGLVIFSACSHAGICNVVRDAVKRINRPVHMVIGGLHLAGPELADRIAPTVNFLSQSLKPAPTYVLPMHCSGFASKVALEQALGEGCVPAGVGTKIVVEGNRDADARLSISMSEA